jgi:hypothetical protein
MNAAAPFFPNAVTEYDLKIRTAYGPNHPRQSSSRAQVKNQSSLPGKNLPRGKAVQNMFRPDDRRIGRANQPGSGVCLHKKGDLAAQQGFLFLIQHDHARNPFRSSSPTGCKLPQEQGMPFVFCHIFGASEKSRADLGKTRCDL